MQKLGQARLLEGFHLRSVVLMMELTSILMLELKHLKTLCSLVSTLFSFMIWCPLNIYLMQESLQGHQLPEFGKLRLLKFHAIQSLIQDLVVYNITQLLLGRWAYIWNPKNKSSKIINQVESFNFHAESGNYLHLANHYYRVCVRRAKNYCGIAWYQSSEIDSFKVNK